MSAGRNCQIGPGGAASAVVCVHSAPVELYRLCGAARSRLRTYTDARLGPMSTRSLARIAAVTVALPPLQANSGWLNMPIRSMSWMRPLRAGPTGLSPMLW
jgi:hypothetical protein